MEANVRCWQPGPLMVYAATSAGGADHVPGDASVAAGAAVPDIIAQDVLRHQPHRPSASVGLAATPGCRHPVDLAATSGGTGGREDSHVALRAGSGGTVLATHAADLPAGLDTAVVTRHSPAVLAGVDRVLRARAAACAASAGHASASTAACASTCGGAGVGRGAGASVGGGASASVAGVGAPPEAIAFAPAPGGTSAVGGGGGPRVEALAFAPNGPACRAGEDHAGEEGGTPDVARQDAREAGA